MEPSEVHFFVKSLRLTFSFLEVSPYPRSVAIKFGTVTNGT